MESARKAVRGVADAMGLPSVEAAAAGIIDIVNENMLGALRLISVQQGFDPRDFALVSFGGAGPLHANALGKLTGSWPVIVPPSPGVLCAYGDATTCPRDEAARTMVRRFSTLDDTELRAALLDLADSTARRLEAEGVPRASPRRLRRGVAPAPGESVVTKRYASSFHGTSLAATLTASGIDTPLICGLTTSGCVRATATDALQHGFRPLVVDDACGDRDRRLHEANLLDLEAKYADVLSLDAALTTIKGGG